MRLVFGVLLLSTFAQATYLTGTVDGVGYTWKLTSLDNYYVSYEADFNALVSAYTLTVDVPDLPHNISPEGLIVQPSFGKVTYIEPYSAAGAVYTISGDLNINPYYGITAMDHLDLSIGSTEQLPPIPGLTFTQLVDPPPTSGIMSTPEPASIILTALGLFALPLARQWTTRRNIPG